MIMILKVVWREAKECQTLDDVAVAAAGCRCGRRVCGRCWSSCLMLLWLPQDAAVAAAGRRGVRGSGLLQPDSGASGRRHLRPPLALPGAGWRRRLVVAAAAPLLATADSVWPGAGAAAARRNGTDGDQASEKSGAGTGWDAGAVTGEPGSGPERRSGSGTGAETNPTPATGSGSASDRGSASPPTRGPAGVS